MYDKGGLEVTRVAGGLFGMFFSFLGPVSRKVPVSAPESCFMFLVLVFNIKVSLAIILKMMQ